MLQWTIEHEIAQKGYKNICGIDEAGRGPLAGPVCAAAVILPDGCQIDGLNDSKKIREKKRDLLFDEIKNTALAYSIAMVDHKKIDEINILNATKSGVTKVIDELEIKPDLIIVDALEKINTRQIPYESIIKGDAKCYSIAAASILAKVTRDRIMREWDKVYPEYNFAQHKGYGTAKHIEAIKQYGLCPIHRRSFTKNII